MTTRAPSDDRLLTLPVTRQHVDGALSPRRQPTGRKSPGSPRKHPPRLRCPTCGRLEPRERGMVTG